MKELLWKPGLENTLETFHSNITIQVQSNFVSREHEEN
jgi:hypothetical protein